MAQLSKEQRHFCREVAKGKPPKLAYMEAFDCKESTAAVNSCRMLKKAHIQDEISRLRAAAKEAREEACRDEGRVKRALWSKLERQEKLQEWAELAVEAGRFELAIKCVEVLNKMDGAYVQEKEISAIERGVLEMRRAIIDATGGRSMVKYG